jgi:phosphatidylglycerophosphate synthase
VFGYNADGSGRDRLGRPGRHPAAPLLAVVCLGINWFGDSLDGTVARVRNCQRPRYGFYVDHVLDTLGTLFVLAGLGLSGYMTPIVAAADRLGLRL